MKTHAHFLVSESAYNSPLARSVTVRSALSLKILLSGAVLPHCSLIPNHAVKAMISDFLDEARRREAALDDDEDEDDDEALPAANEEEGDGGARTTSSRFWGVCWDRKNKKWQAQYYDANGKNRCIGRFDDEEEAARAVNKAIRDAGLQGKRRMNAVDATGALVPREYWCDRSAVVAPDPARDPTATTSKFWGVSWDKSNRRWKAGYSDATGKSRSIGYFDTQEAAAHAVNAAIRRAGLEGKRRTNAVVNGRLVPRELKTTKKRRRDEPAAAAPSTRARRPRRAVSYEEDPDFEL